MILGFHYHVPAIQDVDGSILMPGYLGVFIDGLAKEMDRIVLFLHTPLDHEMEHMDYKIASDNVQLVGMGKHTSFYKRILNRSVAYEALQEHYKELDLLLLRAPSPLLPFLAAKARNLGVKYSFLLVGDYVKTLEGADGISGMKRVVLGSYYRLNKFFQDKFAATALLFANNQVNYDEYKERFKQTYLIRTTTLNQDDFFKRDDTCLNQNVHLMYAGRIEPTKGIEDILNAMVLMKDEAQTLVLNLVGWDPSHDDGHLKYLLAKAEELGLKERVVFHGKKRVGEELLGMYRQADIYILATKGNEGFPRTIWEAMASSMPVIATKVGAIPLILEHNKDVLLVDEHSPEQIAAAIQRLLRDKELRGGLITEGRRLAEENTNEIQAKRMSEIMLKYIKENRDV